jgi:hypothetical protein
MSIAMKKIVLISALLLFHFTSDFSFAQGEAALDFLQIPTNSEMLSMGSASVAHITDNPAALTTNPAHLGMQSLNNSFFTLNENYTDWVAFFHDFNTSIWVRSIVANAGINLNKYYPQLPPLSVGVSYSNIHFHSDNFSFNSGPDMPIQDVEYDESNQVTLSLAVDYFVRASIGITYKHVSSFINDLQIVGGQNPASAKANLYDLGFLLDAPLISIASKIIDQPVKLNNNISPLVNFSLGISKSNLGQESIYYIDPSQADPLPRLARAGIGLAFGFQYEQNDIHLTPFSFKWTIEANDICVTTNSSGIAVYQPGLGDINFFKEVILGKTNKETDKLKGWELNFFESVYIYGGSFAEDPDRGDRNYNTDGYAVSLSGILKTFALIDPAIYDSSFMKYLLNHIGIKYNQSLVNSYKSVLNNTQFYSLNFTFNNWL